MNKAYWKRIQNTYPKSLEKAITYFKSQYISQVNNRWRKEIQKSENIIDFLDHYELTLIITRSSNRYGYEIRYNRIVIKANTRYSYRPNAVWWGIDHAFYLLEQKYTGNWYRPPSLKPSEIRVKNTEGPNWGEQIRKMDDKKE